MNYYEERIYNTEFEDRDDIVLWDVIPIHDGEELTIFFEDKKSTWSQGVWLMCDGGIQVHGEEKKDIVLWYETATNPISIKCKTTNGKLNIYNVWNRGFGINSQSHSSGMVVEDLPNGRRYRCNDIGFDTNFEKLIFRIERAG